MKASTDEYDRKRLAEAVHGLYQSAIFIYSDLRWYNSYRDFLDPAKLDAAVQLSQRLCDVLDELKNDLEKPKNN